MTTTPTSFEHDPFAQAYPEHLVFWQAAEQGRLLLRTCRSCNRPHWYPRVLCPLCGSTDTEWREASGDGTLYAFSVMRRVEQPYAVAYVRLAEGPTLLSNIETEALNSLRIGQPVHVRFRRADEGRLMPVFAPA
ncbi:MAG: Zn-ribbon domain-containing OB-fold protein [Comamonas sp.]